MLKKYFYLFGNDDDDSGVAYQSSDADDLRLKEGIYYENWTIPLLSLKNGGFADYQATNIVGGHLCSSKLKEIIASHADPSDVITWLEARVVSETGEDRPYFLLHLPLRFDILDKIKTIYVKGTDSVIKPYLDRTLVGNHKVFSRSRAVSVIMSDDVKATILAEKRTGIVFESVLLSN